MTQGLWCGNISLALTARGRADYDKAVRNALRITAFLMEELNIPIQNVVRHYDASGKLCPASMAGNNWQGWKAFQKALTSNKDFVQYMAGLESKTMDYLASYTYGDALLEKLKKTMV